MSFWGHVDALRSVLVRIAVVVGVLAVAAFAAMPWLFGHVIMAPCSDTFPTYRFLDAAAVLGGGEQIGEFSPDIVSVELASQMFVHLSASCWVAAIVAFPIILYLLWGFVSPALYPRERRGIVRAFVFGIAMFYLGVAVGYFLVFPLTLRFLAGYTLSEAIRPIVSLDSYMDNFFTLLLMMGAVFEMPVLCWLLGKTGLLKRPFFSRYRRHAVVALLVVAALITPTGDPFTLFIVFFPIYGLWELGSLLVPRADGPEEPDSLTV